MYASTSTTFAAVARRMQVSPAAVVMFAPDCVTMLALFVSVKAALNLTKYFLPAATVKPVIVVVPVIFISRVFGAAVVRLTVAADATYSQVFPYPFIVPAGGTYALTITGGVGTMFKWSELR